MEVYDFATGKKLSKKTCVSTVIFQNDPPILNLPVNQAKIMRQDIQNVIFNWTPRNTNVSNVEYEFSLVELWNPNIPYQTAFDYAPPLYTETTRMTTLQYDMMKPQLIPSKSYAWRVKAKALKGAEEIGMFKNNGFSEVFTFKYLSQCNAPMNVTTEGVSQDQAKIKWTGITTNFFDYQVNYREKNARSKWYAITTPREYATITNLKPNTTYEYTVGTACDKGEYTLSSINEFTTLAKDEIAFAGCGIKPDPADLLNKTPLPALFPNDVVMAGDFPIVVQHASGGNGTFSGDGFVTLPFINKFKEKIGGTIDANSDQNVGIRITFNNIGVNTDFKLISGEIVASYDANWNGMIDGDKLAEEIDNFLKNYKGTDEDKAKALEFHKKQEERSSDLLADANLSQEEKTKIIEVNKNALGSWIALENANPCGGSKNTNDKTQKGGPNVDYYMEEDNFDCYKTPIENETKAIEEAAGKVDALACSMPDIEKGCDFNPMDNGSYETTIKLLKELKESIVNNKPYEYKAHSSADAFNAEIAIGDVCYNPIYTEYTSVKADAKKVDKVSFSKEITTSFAQNEYWTLTFDGFLNIKIQKVIENGKDISKAKIDLLEKWLKCGGKPKEIVQTKPATINIKAELLSDVFGNKDMKRLEEVAKTINKFSNKFEINSPERMSHFLAQTGYESGGFNDIPVEGACYRPKTVESTFKGQTWQTSENLEGGREGSHKCPDFRNGASNISKKYICKEDKPSEKTVTASTISGANLFNYTYRSEFGNGKFESGDGYNYRGRGIIQLTWKVHYIEFNDWLKSNDLESKDIITNPDLVATDFELATLSAMWYWKKNDLNKISDNKKNLPSEKVNENITLEINSKMLGKVKRLEYQQTILEKLKK